MAHRTQSTSDRPRTRDALVAANHRLVDAQAHILILAATQDIDTQAEVGHSVDAIECRLAELDVQLIGRPSRSARSLAGQIAIWYEKHHRDYARGLLREAVVEHVSAALFRSEGRRLSSGWWSRSALAARLIHPS